MKKHVNVRTQTPIVDIKYPIAGVAKNIHLSVDDILTCIRCKAKVEEIVGNRIIPLDFTNYDKDHSIKEVVETKQEEAKVLNVLQVNGNAVIETTVTQEVQPIVEVVEATEIPVVLEEVQLEPLPVVEEVLEAKQEEAKVTVSNKDQRKK